LCPKIAQVSVPLTGHPWYKWKGEVDQKRGGAVKRVFIVCNRPLLGHGLERLIGSEGEVEVVGRDKDLARALTLIGTLRPDAVIVAGDEGEDALAHLFLCLLREGMCGRVIALNTQCNSIGVYRGRRVEIGGIGDLLAAIDDA